MSFCRAWVGGPQAVNSVLDRFSPPVLPTGFTAPFKTQVIICSAILISTAALRIPLLAPPDLDTDRIHSDPVRYQTSLDQPFQTHSSVRLFYKVI